jgi:hypothetical protein
VLSRRLALCALVALIAWGVATGRADTSRAAGEPVESWREQPVGAHGIPGGWRAYETIGGHPAYDFTVVEADGVRALRLRSHDEHSTIAHRLTVNLKATPVLEWTWQAVRLPAGADIRKRETSDLTGHLFVIWPRTPAFLRSRLLGYVWDATLPANATQKSQKTGLVTFVVVRSGPAAPGTWLTERRNVAADYRRIYGEEPDNPEVIALSIDTNDTRSSAEALIGPITFRAE